MHGRPGLGDRNLLRHNIDSMDLLNLVIAVDEQFGVDIPERDYTKLRTLNDMVGYLSARLESAPAPGLGSPR